MEFKTHPYRYYGVLLPYGSTAPNEWIQSRKIAEKDFLYIKSFTTHNIILVRAVATGELYIQKTLAPGRYINDVPEEIRISTCPQALRRLPWPFSVGKVETIHFNELVSWQRWPTDDGWYTLYFRYCNGGTVEQVLEKYCDRGIPVPEHFVWHVAQRLAESLRFLHFGAVPNNGADQPGWQLISHRDFAPNNIFIHYQPRRPGAVRKVGLEGNAFPDVVVGDFGCAGQDGDDKLSPGIYDTDSIKEWEDIYWLGNILRRLCQTHIPAPNVLDVVGKPECYPMSGVDGLMGAGHTPYSDDLIQILQNFEWPGCVADGDPTGLRPGADGLQHENWEWQPTAAWVRDTLLPLARRKANEYRNPPPAAFVPDYYTRLDVSWTKPEELMPFEYDFRYSVAGDEVDGEVEEEGEDEEMPEQPEEPEEPEEPGESLGLEDPQEPQEAQEPQDVQDLEVSVEELEINTSENEDLEDDEVPESESEEHECPVPESEMRMRSLQGFRVHHRDHGQPRFRVMALQFNVPTIVTPVNRGPPSLILEGGGGGGDDDDDVEMGDAS